MESLIFNQKKYQSIVIKTKMSMPMLAGVGLLVVCCSSASAAAMMMGGGEETPAATTTAPTTPTEYVYEFIVNVPGHHTDKHTTAITDIRIDDVRATADQVEVHVEPEWAKCNSKGGGYECEGDVYGMIDSQPHPTTAMNDTSWSQWASGQDVSGTKLFTITTSSKVSKFYFEYFRPKYIPGWIIKENGVEVIKETEHGGTGGTPNPTSKEYTIP
jgi:hypothetical protein